MNNNLPKFLIARFAPGSAGNFISSLLQYSNSVAHWNENEEYSKPNTNPLNYFNKKFTPNMSEWVMNEPLSDIKWGLNRIFSQRHPRGNDLTAKQFLQKEAQYCRNNYKCLKQKKKYFPIFWHKQFFPEFFTNSKSFVIHIDKKSERWFKRAKLKKHFSVNFDSKNKQYKVKFLANPVKKIPLEFRNEVITESTYSNFHTFAKENIINDPFYLQFSHIRKIYSWPIDCMTITLSEILDHDKINDLYISLCESLEIDRPLKKSTILSLHRQWKGCHDFN